MRTTRSSIFVETHASKPAVKALAQLSSVVDKFSLPLNGLLTTPFTIPSEIGGNRSTTSALSVLLSREGKDSEEETDIDPITQSSYLSLNTSFPSGDIFFF